MFKSRFCAAVRQLTERAGFLTGSREETLRQFPFLEDYPDSDRRVEPFTELGLDEGASTLLMVAGLIEEDARFGPLFEALQNAPGQHRPTVALLTALWRDEDDCIAVRAHLRRLMDLGLVQPVNPEASRLEWAIEPVPILWDARRGEKPARIANWGVYRPLEELTDAGDLVIDEDVRRALNSLPRLLETGKVQCVIVRGPRHNGRRTVMRALARGLGLGALELQTPAKGAEERLRLAGPLAKLLHAFPVLLPELWPGETFDVQSPAAPFGVILERHGGVTGPAVERAITLALDVPGPECRVRHWGVDSAEIAQRFRMTSGNIRRAARLARCYAAIDHRLEITLADVRSASRALNRQALETIAVHVPCSGGWERIGAAEDTLVELRTLENRCRHRERLRSAAGPALGGNLGCGVRALFSGPSGTGKTMAARLLASSLGMDLYRLDLAAVVNKYIGETEKSLNQVFARAEELDVILLLDEGDALLTNRTSVQSSNDRYANLETNFLLQRIESFEGILVVTTNAANRIDSAFQRRMDVVVDFRPPDPNERWLIWQLHLPAHHEVDLRWLEEAALRCAFTGGQIRNAVLHASALALQDRAPTNTTHLEESVVREYRKTGAVCPLRRVAIATFRCTAAKAGAIRCSMPRAREFPWSLPRTPDRWNTWTRHITNWCLTG